MKETNQSVSWQGFSYQAFWEAQEALRSQPGRDGSGDGGKTPLIRVLPIKTAVQQIEQSFPLEELREEEIDVEALLDRRTVAEVEDFLEAQGFERWVGLEEVERLIERQTFGVIQFTPKDLPTFTRTLEEINGQMVDTSAFNTHDFEAQAPRLDPRQWRRRNVLNRCRDLAILRDVIHDEQARRSIQQRMNALLQRHRVAGQRHTAIPLLPARAAAAGERPSRLAANARGAGSVHRLCSQGACDAQPITTVG